MVFIFEIIIDISKNFDYFVVIIIEFSEHNRKAVNYRFENLDGFWHWIHSKIHRVFRIFYLINRSLRFMIHFDIFENSKKFFGFPLALCLTAYENRFLRIGATSANCFGCLFWTFVSPRSKNWSSDRESGSTDRFQNFKLPLCIFTKPCYHRKDSWNQSLK